jgi:hypothetical protein
MSIKHLTLIAAACAALATGCGSSPGSSGGGGSSSGSGSPDALSAEAKSAATGDIPDNQNFLTFSDARLGFSMKYPEGWAQKRTGGQVTFQDKNNLVRVAIGRGQAPSAASVTAELTKLKARNATLTVTGAPQAVTVKGKQGVKAVYTTQSAPNPVTGKRVTLMVDRYEFAKGGKTAVLDLGTPKGVDNVDAYRMMSESFKWL